LLVNQPASVVLIMCAYGHENIFELVISEKKSTS